MSIWSNLHPQKTEPRHIHVWTCSLVLAACCPSLDTCSNHSPLQSEWSSQWSALSVSLSIMCGPLCFSSRCQYNWLHCLHRSRLHHSGTHPSSLQRPCIDYRVEHEQLPPWAMQLPPIWNHCASTHHFHQSRHGTPATALASPYGSSGILSLHHQLNFIYTVFKKVSAHSAVYF